MHGAGVDCTLRIAEPPECYFEVDWDAEMRPRSDQDLQQILTWWRMAGQLRLYYIKHLTDYRNAPLYHSFQYMPPEEKKGYEEAFLIHKMFSFPDTRQDIQISKERFYRAVIRCTLMTKFGQFLSVFSEDRDYESFEGVEEIEVIDGYWVNPFPQLWNEPSRPPPGEGLESIEVFDFTSNFLLHSIFKSPGTYLAWTNCSQLDRLDERFCFDIMSLRGPFASELDVANEDPQLYHWMCFIARLQSLLTPFDILQLFDHGVKKEDTAYLTRLACTWDFNESWSPNHTISLLQPNIPYYMWEGYRACGWHYEIRGKVFADDFDVGKLPVLSYMG